MKLIATIFVGINPPKIIQNKFLSPVHIKRWLWVVFLLLLFGCGSAPPRINQDSSSFLFENTDSISIAILPFVDKTDTDGMAKLARDSFYRHLSVRRYRDVELYVIDEILSEHNLTDPDVLIQTSVTELGRILDCDALVLGEITTYQKVFLGIYSQIAVGATISIWDTHNGRLVWFDRHVARFHEGGIPFTLLEIPLISFRSGLNLREKVKMRTLDELSRQLAGRLPGPASGLYTSKSSEDRSN